MVTKKSFEYNFDGVDLRIEYELETGDTPGDYTREASVTGVYAEDSKVDIHGILSSYNKARLEHIAQTYETDPADLGVKPISGI